MTAKPTVAVIGGGWAGCSAALTLAEAGVDVTLYEAARTLGGRARAVEFEDAATLDNGQHILLGAYHESAGLIDRLHGDRDALWRLPLALRQPPGFSLTCPRLPAPLHLLAGLMAAHGLSMREKMSAARWAYRTLRHDQPTRVRTVGELTRDQPGRVNRLLWHPLCISALNTPPDLASADVFCNVLRAAFDGAACDSDLLLPRRDLTALLPAPAAARIADLGGQVRIACRVQGLQLDDKRVAVATREASDSHTHVIVATAPQHVAALLANLPGLEAVTTATSGYRYQPIATGYVQYDASFRLDHPLLALSDGPAQFVFDRGRSHGQAGLMAFVASAADALAADWLDAAEQQLRAVAPPGPARWRQRIVEKQATYSCEPDLDRPDVTTPHPRVWLAGDYTAGPFPATLESAVRSGVQSATALLEKL